MRAQHQQLKRMIKYEKLYTYILWGISIHQHMLPIILSIIPCHTVESHWTFPQDPQQKPKAKNKITVTPLRNIYTQKHVLSDGGAGPSCMLVESFTNWHRLAVQCLQFLLLVAESPCDKECPKYNWWYFLHLHCSYAKCKGETAHLGS